MTTGTDAVSSYIAGLFAHEDQALERTLQESPKRGLPSISIGAEEGRFLQLMVRACGAVKALEIGTLGGYSGIWIARGLAPGGKLITLEREDLHAQVARENFAAAGVAGIVEVRIGNAHDTLKTLAAEAPFDFVFIDAEKSGYPAYFAWAVEHVRPGGVITAHNALWYGKVLDESVLDEDTLAIRAFNRMAAQDPRVASTIFPAGDGTLVAVRAA